ncbi:MULTISPECIES: SDR family NAD(P)-dependent oxidoreductase [Sphingobacterium]|uniref:2-keto-3-deoxy-L-fuconate dehydrogenase n=1 Tax=Sphingobacterium zeae TaxID=1776859 RepID=A0ABU0U3D4_9SPHI|nr:MULTISPECIES: SDR family oxidoreductase [Sphingobacterium]MDQ1149440.1 2-keto-3-deoxy-L-fuconate dehydrogenase [Sphingobacterium zeae]MDR6735461.1 NAD(P)-dependent dehydrogenase (short-subunit alcohol dehydrogenase family) [Sphingobacterium sp. 2149]
MGKLEQKVAVITGGGSGIGRAISLQFAAEGAKVHILDLNEDGGKAVVTEILASGGQAVLHRCNVTDQQEITSIAQNIGKIDILVNNAGIAHVGNLENCQSEDFDRVFNVNVKGAYNALSAVVPLMKAQGSGAILNLASIAAWVGITDRFAYSMSKGAIHAMSMSVARDYMAYGIRCNSISPARVHTPFVDGFIAKNYPGKEDEMFEKLSASQPIGRMAQPEEIAKLALFLCSDDAAFITGNDYPIDGGFIKLNN